MALIICPDCGKEHSDQALACPQCGRPQQSASFPKPEEAEATAKAGTKRNGCLLGCASFIGFFMLLAFIGSLLPNSGTNGVNSTSSTIIDDNSWIPKGYSQYDNNVAFRIRNSSEASCGYRDRCWQMEVVSKNGCDSLYAELTRLGPNKENVGYTNDTTNHLKPGQKAVLTFAAFDDSRGAQLSEINCR